MKCSYCGKEVDKTQREHVFPSNLFPLSKSKSKIQRLTIPACCRCNNSWSDDEAHFRNVLVITGNNPNSIRRELFYGPMARSFNEVDGEKRLRDLLSLMKPIEQKSEQYQLVYPAEDDRILNVVKKVIRGLCHKHDLGSPITNNRVWVDILRYSIPEDYFQQMKYHHREIGIAEYWYAANIDDQIHSAWIIKFLGTIRFISLVSMGERGFPS
jgi:hypothetical protein